MNRQRPHLLAIAVLLGACVVADIGAQQGRTARDLALPQRVTYGSTGSIEVIPVNGDVYMLAGGGSNITVHVGPRELFVVDSNVAAMSDKILAAIQSISKLPIRSVVNTSADPDHVGGNERLAKSAGDNVSAFVQQGARVYSHENAYTRMSNPKQGAPLPTALWPTDAFAVSLKSAWNGEPIELIHQAAAHSDGDLMVFFRKSDVISTGDIFRTDSYPVLDPARGGSLAGIIEGLNRVIDIAVPEFNSMGGTRVIPGHGRLANEIDVVEYRDALVIIGDRVTQRVIEGKTFDQIKAEGVALDYDGIYGATSGPWTTDMFLDAVHKEVRANLPAWRARLTRNVPVDELPQLTTSARPGTRPAAARAAATAIPARRGPADPLEGKWALDPFTSKYTPANLMPYRREMTISFAGDEMTHAASTWRRIGNASPLSTVTYKAKLDGMEYTIPYTTSKVTLKRVNPTTIERTLAGGDGSKESATWTLAADGKTLTVVANGTDPTGVAYTSTQVYEKK